MNTVITTHKIKVARNKRLLRLGLLFCAIAGLALVGVYMTTRSQPVDAASYVASPADWENELLRLTNVDRTSNGMNALLPQGQLTDIARERSDDMIQRQYFSHDIPGGGTVGDIIGKDGIPYQRWGENIGYASGHDTDIVSFLESKWMASTGHRANILNTFYTHFGPGAAVGTYQNVPNVKMFTEVFLQSTDNGATTQPPAQATAAPQQPTPTPVPAPSDSMSFPQTGKTVAGLFLNYWNNNGGLSQQGYPISPEMNEISDLDNKTYKVQYFERAVFEYHPENQAPFNVLLSQLGTFQYKQKYPTGAPGQTQNQSNGKYFPETGHWVGGKFYDYWQSHGGLSQQGFPISDEFTEVSDLNGQSYKVQYFERSEFEYHPENQAPNDVLLSQLGTARYKIKYPGK